MIGNMMPGAGSHIFTAHGAHCIYCDATQPGYNCRREPAIETVMYQALVAAYSRPCGSRPCADEHPGMPSRWCSGCVIAALIKRLGWPSSDPRLTLKESE